MTRHTPDVLVVGGGIAGLWVLNHLVNRGYNAVLLEAETLGGDQSVASQGMIHGGIKYSLGGAFTGASEAIADMPDHWRACLRGEGDVDLRAARVLSEHFYLWSTDSVASRLGGFLASKATRGRVDRVRPDDYPPALADPGFRGSLYKLVDMVVDTPSVLAALADRARTRLFRLAAGTADWRSTDEGRAELVLPDGDVLAPRAVVLAAGSGNGELLQHLGARQPHMQLRPLQQVMVRHHYPHRFYGHCVTADKTPRLTISSHPLADGSQVWYLGGALAEKGADRPAAEVIDRARRELETLMPWVPLANAEWETLPVARAEPRQHNLARPDQAFAAWARGPANVIAAWPTKLTLAPHLAASVAALLTERGIEPGGGTPPPLALPRPAVAPSPWARVFGVADATA